MADRMQIYRCEICGNIVCVLHGGKGELYCCGQPMNLLQAKTEEEGKEKHLPVVEISEDRVKVKVGSISHPMEDKHFIEWIEIMTDKGCCIQFLNPGDAPEAEFTAEDVRAVRAYCNIHGLWKKEVS